MAEQSMDAAQPVNRQRPVLRGAMLSARRGQSWRNIIDVAVASARARTRARGVDHATPPRLMLGAAEALRVIVTRLGPTERGWALASAASDLERTAFARVWTASA